MIPTLTKTLMFHFDSDQSAPDLEEYATTNTHYTYEGRNMQWHSVFFLFSEVKVRLGLHSSCLSSTSVCYVSTARLQHVPENQGRLCGGDEGR